MQILEILKKEDKLPDIAQQISIFLKIKASHEPAINQLIYDGLYLTDHPIQNLINA
jgi:hypothetical protein